MARSRKSVRAAAALGKNLSLAPAVIAMRLPLIAAEIGKEAIPRESMRAVTEKAAAVAEGMVAAQLSLAVSASRFWFELYSGKTPSLLSGEALRRASHAAMVPSGKAVRGNFGRLTKRAK